MYAYVPLQCRRQRSQLQVPTPSCRNTQQQWQQQQQQQQQRSSSSTAATAAAAAATAAVGHVNKCTRM
jgi:hypothetical protein